MEFNDQVAAIIVTYNPDFETLSQLINSISPQVGLCLIVDNTPNEITASLVKTTYQSASIQYKWMKKNVGLSTAHNHGIKWAEKLNKKYVVIFDQDSIPSKTMISEQMLVLNDLTNNGIRVSSVGPLIIHRKLNRYMPIIKIDKYRVHRIVYVEHMSTSKTYERVSFPASSGSLIPVTIFQHVGYMDDSLFIDHIDTDWHLRAIKKGYSAYVALHSKMQHSLGENSYRIWLGKWRYLSKHKPFRYYYMFRNTILLYKRDYTYFRWQIFDMRRSIQIFIMCLLIKPRYQNLKMIAYGIIDGIQGKTGESTRF